MVECAISRKNRSARSPKVLTGEAGDYGAIGKMFHFLFFFNLFNFRSDLLFPTCNIAHIYFGRVPISTHVNAMCSRQYRKFNKSTGNEMTEMS